MSKSRIVTALDIGSSKITTLIAQVTTDPMTLENSVNIVGVSSQPGNGVKKGQIVDIEDAVESTIVSVEAAERMAGYNVNKAFVAVGGAHVSSQNSTGVVAVSDPDGEVSPDDVERVIESARAVSLSASREIIHVIPREFIVDGEAGVRDPVGMSGVRLEVGTHLVTASSAALKNLAKTVNGVGIDVEQMVFSGLASSYSTLTDTEKELGCVLIDIGAGTTSIAAFLDGALAYSGAVPIGAKNVTNDLAIGLRVSIEQAEKIKIALSNSKDDKDKKYEIIDVKENGKSEEKKVARRTLTEGIIKPRLNELFNMVKSDLEKAGIINKVPSGAVLTGGGALTVGVEDSARRVLSLPVRIGKPKGVGGLIDDIMSPHYASPIGLVLYAASTSQGETTSSGGGMQGKIKMPKVPIISKFVDNIRDLLP